ncbi:MAG: ATP-grasp domain-containing protein [bacterium]|nr:ATP-grasp domain-containing protein [bacterium]
MNRFDPVTRIAIVNRGEAAMRCIRAIKALRSEEGSDLCAIALYTEIDRDAPFVRHADDALLLPSPNGEVAAYLDHDGLIAALRKVKADAVWPGWGFVAEDASFVERLASENIKFLGPDAAAMRALGDKIGSKHLAEEAGVPVTAWSGCELESLEDAERHAKRVGYPLVIKASAGGGGRGIRVVDTPDTLAEAYRSAGAEAGSAFGDERLFLEKKVEGGRHIEVQIAADRDGVVRAIGCRDCSVQRRHQKVIEEGPPPHLEDAEVLRLEAYAVQMAEVAGYVGVGTVEFLISDDGFFFLEMNPRLQVEHGITEEIAGVDLVQTQIRIARGETIAELEIQKRGAAIEARVCAEDPDAGFLPAPGRIARFDPALGPRVRLDSGVAAGSEVPSSFDSLVAKVIATGDTREEARARLVSALLDFDLVIEGGTTNKGYLLDILEHADFRAGGVDTTWLDRLGADQAEREYADVALLAASILSYQRHRALVRLNFFSDPGNMTRSRLGAPQGQEIDLNHNGDQYRLEVYATGGWRYRVHLEGRVLTAKLREEGEHAARLEIENRTYRLLYDVTEAGLRVEVEGRSHRFDSQTAGQVRAAAPAMVVAVHVEPGDSVISGQPLGLLEAMKMEVAFEAPVSGVVSEVRVRKGEQVAAGDVIVVIDVSSENGRKDHEARRIVFEELSDPLEPLFSVDDEAEERLGRPDLVAADQMPRAIRRDAIEAVRDEVRRVLLGYDANPERADRLAVFLEAPLPEELSEGFRWELAELRHELVSFADVAILFIRSPAASISGVEGPSNAARLRMFIRRLRASGAGLTEVYLDRVRQALAHYGVKGLEPSDALERAVLRLMASQLAPERRDRLVLAMLRRVGQLAQAGVHLGDDKALALALDAIAGMRGFVSHAVADAATLARYQLFERPDIERLAESTTKEVKTWLEAAESAPTAPPEGVLFHLADAPRVVFDRVGRWLDDPDRRRRSIALASHLRRIYSPAAPLAQASQRAGDHWVEKVEFAGGRIVLAGTVDPKRASELVIELVEAAASLRESHEWPAVHAIELFVPVSDEDSDLEVSGRAVEVALEGGLPAGRFTLTGVRNEGASSHRTWVPTPTGFRSDGTYHGIHPEAAARIDLDRLANFELERITGPEDIYCFHGRSREVKGDERLFVLADMRSRSPDDGREAALHLAAFEHIFFEATRSLRGMLTDRDPKRRLQWNRLHVCVAPEVFLDAEIAERLSRRLAPATRNLGLEKVVVRLRLLDRSAPEVPSRDTEIVISDITGANMTIQWREPRKGALSTRNDYERRVVEARRRRLVYPYEIIRMLSGSRGEDRLPAGSFVEYDLDPESETPRALPCSDRPYGRNVCSVVFGVMTTPTEKVPEGMKRVVVLSDPTQGMGSLASAECDRIVAAIDLAASLHVPVEWVPVSSGARIAMDSGTENLDATARVVRRIIEFTQAGGSVHVIVAGVNVGAQSYWDSLSTMLMHTKGALIMTQGASMVLTGRAALDASGAVSGEDEAAIGGFERIMGPNGEAQYFANDLGDAYRILYDHYRYTYIVPGEMRPRPFDSGDPEDRDVSEDPASGGFETVGEIFDDAKNPGRKRPFPMRPLMEAVVDRDGGHLERWRGWAGAEMAVVWDAHLGGTPVCLVGIESQGIPREGYLPADGPNAWTGGTLFPLSSKKMARALNAASGNRPVVILANLSGFDGSPESMRKLQLEYGAEIARAVVNFDGPILFLVVSRYHGGAYVVFSRELNPRLRAAALSGSYASVIGGGPAAAVIFSREVRSRALADERVRALRSGRGSENGRASYEQTLADVALQKQAELAEEFDEIHSVERALEVGSLEAIVGPDRMRPYLIDLLREELEGER